MVKLGYNPSTGKTAYNASNKLCVGCCVGTPPCADNTCVDCPTDTTPCRLRVTLSGYSNICSDCFPRSGFYSRLKVDSDLASIINTAHSLYPNVPDPVLGGDHPCIYARYINVISLGYKINTYNFSTEEACNSGDCDGEFAFQRDLRFIGIRMSRAPTGIALVIRLLSTSFEVDMQQADFSPSSSVCFSGFSPTVDSANPISVLDFGSASIQEIFV